MDSQSVWLGFDWFHAGWFTLCLTREPFVSIPSLPYVTRTG